jgi:hypothetical protein
VYGMKEGLAKPLRHRMTVRILVRLPIQR